MKYFIASDIHGSLKYCKNVLEAFEREKADRLLLLGDILYHGPRNDLPEEYNPKAVIELLNQNKNKMLCVRGNCDTEVDQMVLDFPILSDYCILSMGKTVVYATHGHVYGEWNPPKICNGEVLLCGHTHVPKFVKKETFYYMNPGSVSIPKENSWHGYMLWEENVFTWKDFDGMVKMEHAIGPVSTDQ